MSPQLKQFGDLTPADFEAHCVWVSCHGLDQDEPWYEQTDEETFRPWTGPLPVNADLMYLVSTRVRLADGSTASGFATPKPDDGIVLPRALGTMQPQLFAPTGARIAFWLGMFPSREMIEAAYRALGKKAIDIFPARFDPLPGLTSGICAGEIPGFCSIPRGMDSPVKVEQ